MKFVLVVSFVVLWTTGLGHAEDGGNEDKPNGNNVFIITLDGYRWQELFLGADSAILHNPSFTDNIPKLKTEYWHEDITIRRAKLMPFVWSVISKKGQLFGNRKKGNRVNTKNFYSVSYPGYNEIFTGVADPFVSSNKKIKNRNISLLEYLNKMPQYAGRVAVYTSWNMFPYILNEERSNLFINSGYQQKITTEKSYTKKLIEQIRRAPGFSEDAERNDRLTYLLAKEYILKYQPKVLHLGLGGTDSYGHQKNYGKYLKEAHEADRIIEDLWNLVQTSPFYRNKTTIIITTDHGRGNTQHTWHKHGTFVTGASQTWVALLGKSVKPLGEHFGGGQLYQKHLAGTIGYLIGVKSYKTKMMPVHYFE